MFRMFGKGLLGICTEKKNKSFKNIKFKKYPQTVELELIIF